MSDAPTGLYTIPPGQSFARALVRGIAARWHDKDDPLSLTRMTILLPTRRAVRSLREAFRLWAEEEYGAPLLLPVIRPLGDVDEDELGLGDLGPGADALDLPPAMPNLRRQLLLARLILQWQMAKGGTRRISLAAAVNLAGDLGTFLDTVQTEEAALTGLEALAPDRFADHWRQTIEFLEIITQAWPAILQEQGFMDGAERRRHLMDAQSAAWAAGKAPGPVIAAGSTGSIPATARLLKVIARLEEGAVVLPGLDQGLDDPSWEQLEPSHPQYGLKLLLGEFGCARSDVKLWPGSEEMGHLAPRNRLINEALRPAGTTDGWLAITQKIVTPEAIQGMTRIDAPTPALEARTIALIMREALETPDLTAMLVTPDRALAHRVALELHRWNVDVDDSGGRPLPLAPQGVFLKLIIEAFVNDFAPVQLLALLKHPFCVLGLSPERREGAIALLEAKLLRGLAPPPGLDGLEEVLASAEHLKDEARNAVQELIHRLRDAMAPLLALARVESADLADFAKAHGKCAEALATMSTDEPGADYLWIGEAGEAAAQYLEDLMTEGTHGVPLTLADYAAVFSGLISARAVRPAAGRHPRLHILGPLEARIQQADIVILGGLNEGIWPADPGIDPWLNRPMREALGLSVPERRIGLAAHDFAQLASAKRVVLTRSQKAGGAPQVPSRWLLRLENLLKGAGHESDILPTVDYCHFAAHLDEPSVLERTPEPRPSPPVEARPTKLSLTEIETLIRDPYSIYARHVLKLRPLEPLARQPGPPERGTALHAVLEQFVKANKSTLPDDALARLEVLGREALAPFWSSLSVQRFWWPRYLRAMAWFVEAEAAWRNEAEPAAMEVAGEWTFQAPVAFTLRGRADRIDRLLDSSYAVIDYKTGQAPSGKQVKIGLEPQLALGAVLLEKGGFEGLPKADVSALRYIRLPGGTPPGEVIEPSKKPAEIREIVESAEKGLLQLIAQYGHEKTPYLSRPRPMWESAYGDYDHLARVKAWGVADDGEEGA